MTEQEIKDNEQRFKDKVIDELFAGKIVDAFPDMEFERRPGGGWQSRHHLDGSEDSQKKFITVVGEGAKFNVHDHARGDRGIIDLYMDQNNIDYKEARKQLSKLTGVPLPAGTGTDTATANSTTELAKQNSRMGAAKAFKAALWSNTDEAKKALDYLRNSRGLNDEQIEKMGLGLITRSILNTLDKNAKDECKYFSRKGIAIAWPYTTGGKIAGFKFREIYNKTPDDDKVFLNSKGLPISGPLFNLKSRQRIAIVVESELDALLAEISGIDNVVATAGAGGLSKKQIEDAQQKGVKDFILLFDNDTTGRNYTKAAIENLDNVIDNVTVVTGLPEGVKDVGEYLQQYDVESLKAIVSKAEPAIAYKFKDVIPPEQMENFLQFEKSERDRHRIEAQAKEAFKQAEQLFNSGQALEALALVGEKSKALRIHTREGEFEKIFAEPSAEEYFGLLSHLNKGLPTGIRFGEEPLQETLTLIPGLTFICGNTGHGKTSVLNNIALNEAKRNIELQNGKKVLYFSYEISRARLVLDLLNTYVDNPSIGKSPYNSIMGYFQAEDEDKKDQYFHDYSREPRLEDRDPNKKRQNYEDFVNKERIFRNKYILDGAILIIEENYTVESLLDALKFAVDRNDVSLICLDYAQLIYSEKPSRQRTEEIKKIVNDIKDFAEMHQLPVVMAAQFNQQVRVPANVKLTNIGEGGDYARIANTVVGIFNLERFDLDVMENEDTLKPLHKFGIQTYDDCKGKMFLRLLKRRYSISDLDLILEWRGKSKKIVPNYPGDLKVDAIQASLQLTVEDQTKREANDKARENEINRERSGF